MPRRTVSRTGARGGARLDSMTNEAECINDAVASSRTVLATIEGVRLSIARAIVKDGNLMVSLTDAPFDFFTVHPATILSGGRGVWSQIEIMSQPMRQGINSQKG
jgi:hypothetical protein